MKTRVKLILFLFLFMNIISIQSCTSFDAEKPVVNITNPMKNDEIIGPKLIVSGTISDTDNDQDKVKVSIDGTNIAAWDNTVSDGTFSVTLDITNLTADQTYNIIAVGYDKNKNESESVYISITYKGTKPQVVITNPINNYNIIDTTIIVSGTISDADNDQDKVKISIDGTSIEGWDNTVSDGTFSVTLDITNLTTDQTYNIIAVGYDKKGNESNPNNISITYKGTKPQVTITNPVPNADIIGSTLVVSGTINDPDNDQDKVKISIDGTSIEGWDNTVSDGTFSVTLYNINYLNIGQTYTIIAIGYDKKGNESNLNNISITYKGRKPQVTISSPINNDDIFGFSLLVSGTISDADNDQDRVKISIDGTSIEGWDSTVSDGTFSVTLDITNLTGGQTYNIIATGYDENDNESNPAYIFINYKGDIYIAGNYSNGSNLIGCYWKNGTKYDLPSGSGAYVNSVFVSGTDVYLAGRYADGSGGYVACYWKNGEKYDLPGNPSSSTGANSIYVSGTDVYVAGTYLKGLHYVACYWKNGTKYDLTDGSSEAVAFSIYVSGTDVYIAGKCSDGTACYWKNGTKYDLIGGSIAYSIYISGTDVYIAGNRSNGACYWKNGEKYDLPGVSGSAKSIYVSGTDVYVAGYYNKDSNWVACYWKNGIKYDLTDGSSTAYANSIFVSGSDVYVVGYYDNGTYLVACYWKNGTKYDLANNSNHSSASSIFIVD